MKRLNDNELMSTNGGGSSILIASIVTGIVVFVVGILSGYSNPAKCD